MPNINLPKACLPLLPPEMLILILQYSLNANLIHANRQLRNKLPAFAEWSKALAVIALCFTDMVDRTSTSSYRSQIGISRWNSLAIERVRASVFTSSWFTPSHFLKTITSLRPLARVGVFDDDGFHARRTYHGTIPREVSFGRHGSIELFRLQEHNLVISISRKHRPQGSITFNIWSCTEETVSPTAIINLTIAKEFMRDTYYNKIVYIMWGVGRGDRSPLQLEDIQDIITVCILQNQVDVLKDTMNQWPASRAGPRKGSDWRHVVLAATMGRVEALKVLLHQPVWPAWHTNGLRQLADDVKASKSESRAAVYRLLKYEWRMQRSQEKFHVQRPS